VRFWAIVAEGDPEAIELFVRREDAERFLSTCGPTTSSRTKVVVVMEA
jgi:hypothetical protein